MAHQKMTEYLKRLFDFYSGNTNSKSRIMKYLRLFYMVAIFCTIERASGDFLSFGISHAICKSQQKFSETGKLLEALKENQNEIPNECKWFQRSQKSECSLSTNCSDFSEKSCAELGISEEGSSDPSVESRLRPLIVGGREIDPPFKYPSFVWINSSSVEVPDKKLDDDIEGKFFCGAVILNEEWVLTAAHCIFDFDTSLSVFGILAGRHNLSVPEETEQYSVVAQAIYHPNATDPDLKGIGGKVDLVLLRLESPFKFNTEKISPAQLPTKVYDTGDFTLVGRGVYLDFGNETLIEPKVPQEVDLPIITMQRCREIALEVNTNPEKIPDHAMCFYREPPEGGTASAICKGDSGSPLYKVEGDQQILVGIGWASTNGFCGQKGYVSMYMQVYPFLQWIQENISKSK